MNIFEFHSKLSRHCNDINGECSECKFIDYCYSQKRDIHSDFIENIISGLSSESNDIIKNPHNRIERS